jgi:outer membrane receptor protein involved in Fe transport
MKKPYFVRRSLLSASVSAAVGAFAIGGLSTNTLAQDEELEEIVVTGSRIVRRDYESNSPIVTVDNEDFEQQTGLNIESYLNQLPTYNPAASPVTTQGDVQITPVNSVGIASISLRGFGPNRSLVLVNGKRPTPINALMVTDINGVPSALIERVETITGGASAVYGADAIGGVTNFILRDNFEGFEFDSQYGTTEAGDGDEYRLSAVLGANFADGRGNVTMGIEQYSRKAAYQRERDIYTDFWNAKDTSGSFFFLQGTNSASTSVYEPSIGGNNYASKTALNSIYGGQNPLAWFSAFSASPGNFNFNSDGSIFVSGNAFGETRADITPVNGDQYAYQTVFDNQDATNSTLSDVLKWNNTQAFASAPQDRWSFFASGTFDINDNITAFARANFAESTTRTLLFGTNAIGGWETFIPYDPNLDSPVDPALDFTDVAAVQAAIAGDPAYANPNFIPTGSAGAHFPVPVELAILLNSRAVQDGRWQPNWNPDFSLPPRNTYNTNEVWQVEFGLNIDLPIKDWTAELYYSHGQSSTYNVAGGNLSLTRFRTLTNYPDYGRGASGTGNEFYLAGNDPATAEVVNTVRPAFGAGDFTCETGFYDTFFSGDAPLSEDCFNAVNATLQTRTQNQQDIIEVNVQGSLIELPAGEARFAAGFQARDNAAQFNPDILQSQDSFTDQVVGVYPTGYLDASTSVKDYYVEALVPVLSDIPGIQMLELELGARYSDYTETDAETTWKALANWQINDWARLRGGFNRATRAPNLGELFLNQQEIFTGGGNFGDACSVRSNAPYGAGGTTYATDPVITPPPPGGNPEPPPSLAPGQTQAGADSAFLICQALMGGAGSQAEQEFYFAGNDVVQQTGGGGFAWVLQEGNPELNSETADTWTFGAVINSPWDNAWLSGLTASFDFYDVEIDDAIMLYSLDYAAYRCYGSTLVTTAAEAQAQAATLGCQLTPRDQANGNSLSTLVSYDNQATIQTSGMDIGLNWYGELSELFGWKGGLGLSLNATILDSYKTKQSPAIYDVETEWKGSLGPDLSGTNGGAYDFRLFGNVSYILDNWSVTLRWRHLPGVHTAGWASQQAIIENNARVSAGGDGLILGYTPTREIETDSYNIFDLAFNWNYNETVTFRGGITNLFDEEPPNVGSNAARGGQPADLALCNGAPGCSDPTGPALASRGGYNGGYYDTLGRRFFLGVKMNF